LPWLWIGEARLRRAALAAPFHREQPEPQGFSSHSSFAFVLAGAPLASLQPFANDLRCQFNPLIYYCGYN
jgi:hypothetical protein